ncbi:GntR family transcriptional regulator [Aquincola sp. MAHUQ-54]|uniref:GntR family transcriptional regulator n=1 Tax=Aquincola agrisoli TaxID=3119538 RepID=A0AAW9QJK5_9BURK
MSRMSERLRESIEAEIATGKLPPGTRLEEIELAKRFGVSRTPVREALSLLLGEGFVESGARGMVVTQVSPTRLIEMFEVMAELEAMCARLAARRMTDQEIAALESAHEECRKAAASRDTDAYFYANERFHFAIYAGSHNSFLVEEAVALQRRLRPYRRLQLRVRNRVNGSFEEHQAILDALRDGDAEAATLHLRGHVLVQGERFADLIASLDQLTAGPVALPSNGPPSQVAVAAADAPATRVKAARRA